MVNNTWERTRSGQVLTYPTGPGCVGETELGLRVFVASDDAETIEHRLFQADVTGQQNT